MKINHLKFKPIEAKMNDSSPFKEQPSSHLYGFSFRRCRMKKNFETWEEYQCWQKIQDIKDLAVMVTILFTVMIVLFCTSAHAQLAPTLLPTEVNVEKLADAIFLAEGGYKATYLYGIRSVSYDSEAEARQICIRTIRNNFKRFNNQTKYSDYLAFLGSRYAPTKNCDNDPRGLNNHWVKNVRSIYGRMVKNG